MDFWEDLFNLLDHAVVGHHIAVEVQEPSLVGRVQDVRHAVEGDVPAEVLDSLVERSLKCFDHVFGGV